MTDRHDAEPEWPGPIPRATLDALRDADSLRDSDALAGVRLDRVTVGGSAVLVELGTPEVAVAAIAGPARVWSAVADGGRRSRTAVADGHCGTDLHGRGVRKVYVARDAPETMDLRPSS
ncbi:hypothetical protein [Halorubrum trueperi]|uniref:Uncharacterized protein n=1 Tax=Halorubrum trueperi TaxID=2004704 RepID=A0ABD5UJ36_9EURY